MRTVEITIYTIDTHPDKEKVFSWIRDNWHDLGGHLQADIYESIKKLEKLLEEGTSLKELNLIKDELPLTGCWSDLDVINAYYNGKRRSGVRKLYDETVASCYTDEAIEHTCEANEYEFYEDGSFYYEK